MANTIKIKCKCGVEVDLPKAIVKNAGSFFNELKEINLQVHMDGLFHIYFGTCICCDDFLLAIKAPLIIKDKKDK